MPVVLDHAIVDLVDIRSEKRVQVAEAERSVERDQTPQRDAATERRFNSADTNHDGWLSKGELLMMRQRMGPRGG